MDPVPGLDLGLPPFDLLDEAQRRRLLASVDIGFHPGGTTLIEAGRDSPHVHVVMKGLVHAYEVDDRGRHERFADYGPGDVIGAWAVMARRARLSYRAEGDCLTHLIPAATFRQLIADNPRIAAWFNEGLATKGRLAGGGARPEAAGLMAIRVGEADLAPAEHVDATTTIAEASARLRERRVDCLLVFDRAHDAPGIVTRTDLLEALTRQRLPLDAPIGPLASQPLATIGTGEVLFQALIGMTERQIERVVVTEGGRIAGTLGMAEVLAHFAVPLLAGGHGVPQVLERGARHVRVAQDVVRLADQFLAGVAGQLHERLVGVGDDAVQVGAGNEQAAFGELDLAIADVGRALGAVVEALFDHHTGIGGRCLLGQGHGDLLRPAWTALRPRA